MNYMQKSFNVRMPSDVKQDDWDKIFGKKNCRCVGCNLAKRMRTKKKK